MHVNSNYFIRSVLFAYFLKVKDIRPVLRYYYFSKVVKLTSVNVICFIINLRWC